MLRLTTHHKSRISNRLAGFSALLLLVASLAGAGNPASTAEHGVMTKGAVAEAVDNAPLTLSSRGGSTVKKNKGFKMSLFLFRSH